MRLILVRHGETPRNRERRVQGVDDVSLTDLGQQQAQAVAQALAREPVVAVYSSPLRRALETAHPIAELHGQEVRQVRDLREADVGLLDGMRSAELHSRYPDFIEQWRQDPTTRMPGGESLVQVQERVWPVAEGLRLRHWDETVVLVAHNFVLQVLLARMMGMPLLGFRQFRLGLATLSEVRWDRERWDLVRFNEACHLLTLLSTAED